MVNGEETKKTVAGAKDLLIEDYRYLSESFLENEQMAKTRVNLFFGLVQGRAG